MLMANTLIWSKKMLINTGRCKHGKLKNALIFSVEDSDNLTKQSLDDTNSSKLCGMELSNTEFFGLATQEFKIILHDALERGK